MARKRKKAEQKKTKKILCHACAFIPVPPLLLLPPTLEGNKKCSRQ